MEQNLLHCKYYSTIIQTVPLQSGALLLQTDVSTVLSTSLQQFASKKVLYIISADLTYFEY